MAGARRTGIGIAVVCLCCLALLAVGPVAGAGSVQPTVSNASDEPVSSSEVQPASTCFDVSGASFTIGSEDGTHIWLQFHAGPLTDSDWAFGAEMIGATEDASIVELLAGVEYVGDGVFDLVSSPIDSFDLRYGFEFQLPMLESATDVDPMDPDDELDGDDRDDDGTEDSEPDADRDSRYELLDC
ncbi:DUF7332 family protein [Natronolimnohabitans innermongolicus]|uniref:Uncharacterized protein n=1 Tax=Natronolimnohabitans innermongolicus JCM 12255 TaxID=1227499 RepID=L9XET2_9EURY|nr:hypothetical protein [Natronolimnohabitans innermongolicus]ELY59921.1 hypothetical protein C493_04813 [Natronolimnohabitans innermongolicus JCM 12255]